MNIRKCSPVLLKYTNVFGKAKRPIAIPPQHRTVIAAALLLLLLISILLGHALFSGRVLLPADLIFEIDPLWQPLAPPGYTYAANHILSDQVYMFFPWKTFTLRSFSQGYLPLWNPYINGGQPFIGNNQSALFSPFSLIGYLFPHYSSYVVTAMLRLFVTGIFTYLFAREIGIKYRGALIAMIAFTFSGPIIGWLGHPHSLVIAWLPAMLLTVERALRQPNAQRIVACGLCIGMQFLGGHPETLFWVMAFWSVYALYRVWGLAQGRWKDMVRYGKIPLAAAILGILLSAIQLWPFAESLVNSATLATRQSEAAERTSLLFRHLVAEWQQWPTLITTLLPNFFGSPLDKSYVFPFSNYVEQNAYVGVLPLVLAVVAIFRMLTRRPLRHPHARFFALGSLICLGIAVRAPVLNVVNYLPIFNLAAKGRLRLIYAFVAAILVGIMLNELEENWNALKQHFLRTCVTIGTSTLLINGLTWAGLKLFKSKFIEQGRLLVDLNWGTPYFTRPLAHYYRLVDELYAKTVAHFQPGSGTLLYLPVAIIILTLALYWFTRKKITPTWSVAAIVALTALDLLLIGRSFHPTTAPQDIFPKPAAIAFLEQDTSVFRIGATDLILYPNTSMVFALQDVRGYEAVVPRRYVELIKHVPGHSQQRICSLLVHPFSPLLDLFNVKYILSDRPPGGRWELVYDDGTPVKVYRNPDVLPRAFVVYRAEIVETPAQSLRRVTDSSFDFRRVVVLEEKPAGWNESAGEDDTSVAHIVGYLPNRVSIEVETAHNGLLVLTDAFAPGWQAYVDGQKTKIYVADHAFRAIVMPTGRHQVEFVYRPLSFWGGAAISLMVAMGMVGGMLTTLLKAVYLRPSHLR